MRYDLIELYIALDQAEIEHKMGLSDGAQFHSIFDALIDEIGYLEVQIEIERDQQEYEIPTDQDWWEMIGY